MEVMGKNPTRCLRSVRQGAELSLNHRLSAQPFLQHRLIFEELKLSFAHPSSFSSLPFSLAVNFLVIPFRGVRKSTALLSGSGTDMGISHFKRHSEKWRKNLSNFLNLLTPRRQEWKSRIFVIKMIAAICRSVWGHKHLPGRFSVSHSEGNRSPE